MYDYKYKAFNELALLDYSVPSITKKPNGLYDRRENTFQLLFHALEIYNICSNQGSRNTMYIILNGLKFLRYQCIQIIAKFFLTPNILSWRPRECFIVVELFTGAVPLYRPKKSWPSGMVKPLRLETILAAVDIEHISETFHL